MTVTTLDPRTALIVVDLQKGIVSYPTVHPIAEILRSAGELTQAFRRRSLPVVLVNVAGIAPGRTAQPRRGGTFPEEFTHIVAELAQAASDHLVTKHTWGAFTKTDLDAYLKSHGITQVVIIGVATSIGVESTARQAHELGFNVSVATDAVTDLDADAHSNSVVRIFPRLGETGTTAEILDLLK